MSGIVGIVNLDGAPIDRALLSRMTSSLDFRGPDARRNWVAQSNNVGFGHTLLRTTYEAEHEQQPFTLDGSTWVVADCRVDAREELLAKLRAKGRDASLHRPDVELILHAWHVWGEECVEHLLGDFAFAIWDAQCHRLFCARDHMGVKPFYYAHIGSTLIFSNTLDCVRMHPAVSDELNDLAIADFLLFGGNEEHSPTVFSDILRLPPAHTIQSTGDVVHVRRYWTLPIEEPVYCRHDRDYTDRFLELLRKAVADRLRTPTVSVFMSGGLDSSGLAAVAANLLRDGPHPDPVCAFTSVFDTLMPDSERHYAGLVAHHLNIPIQFFAVDRQTDWAQPGSRHTPEPVIGLPEMDDACAEQYAAMAGHSRVALYGEGPDNALVYEWRSHLTWLARQRRWGRLLADIGKHLAHHKRVPLLPTVPRMFRVWSQRKNWEPSFPEWLNPEFVERLQLRDRWREANSTQSFHHPVRPCAYASFHGTMWQQLFEGGDPPYTNTRIEVRHPFVDIRMVQFLLSVPAMPWCRKKLLLRRAFCGMLPQQVLSRPKTPLSKKPQLEQSKLHGSPPVIPRLQLLSYGNLPDLDIAHLMNAGSFQIAFRFAALGYWLQSSDSITKIDTREEYESRKGLIPAGTL